MVSIQELLQEEGEETQGASDTQVKGLIPVHEATPANLIVLPLEQAVPFPGLVMPIQLQTDLARSIVAKAEADGGYLALFARRHVMKEGAKPGKKDRLDPNKIFDVGVVVKVLQKIKLPNGEEAAMLQGIRRIKRTRVIRRKPFLIVRVKDLHDIPSSTDRAKAQFRNLQHLMEKVIKASPHLEEDFLAAALNVHFPGQLADYIAAYVLRDHSLKQKVLEALDIEKRLDLVVEALTKEATILELGKKIQDEIRAKVEKAQKEYFLREQIRIIRRELGEEVDSKEAEIRRLSKQIEAAGLPEEALAKAREELERLRVTPVESPEHAVLSNHLDWILALPWNKKSEDRRNIRGAAKVLDEDHFGLKQVKERILEFLAVHKLREGSSGTILCLSGPPGVGKTSLGRSIARAMGRKFWRFSLGGMRDEAEIKGHRRTYVGAMPGRILQGLKQCDVQNPVIMLDEVDKLGNDFRGDPSSALLEVLDPEQNHAFLDHYLDLPFDLSKVFFIATANVLMNIPAPLRDRMEIIEIPGYLTNEKVAIAREHLLPKQRSAHGLGVRDLSLSARVLQSIVLHWTREAGVRTLEKCIARICRKRALAIVRRRKINSAAISVTELPKFLGPMRYSGSGERKVRVSGICQGLAWTPVGGEVLFIETTWWKGKGEVRLTGQVGEVMKESVSIAMDYLKSRAELFGLDLENIGKHDLHIHFPAGAVPKDGPSAGITVASALLSLFLGKRCPKDLAMTGELTVVGEVLPIGGVREKVLAARREKIRRIILPAENRSDVEEIDKELLGTMDFHYVDTYEEVWKVLSF